MRWLAQAAGEYLNAERVPGHQATACAAVAAQLNLVAAPTANSATQVVAQAAVHCPAAWATGLGFPTAGRCHAGANSTACQQHAATLG